MADVLSRMVSSSGPRGAALWPVPCGATRRPRERAASMVSITSWTEAARTTAAGRWSTDRCHAWRATSHSGSPGRTRSPSSRTPSASRPAIVSRSVSRNAVISVLLLVWWNSDEGGGAERGVREELELGDVVRAGGDEDVGRAGGLEGGEVAADGVRGGGDARDDRFGDLRAEP